jgi:hypothetical protein
MFDYSVLTVDVDNLLIASDINLSKARELLVLFAVQEKAKTQKIIPEQIDSLKQAINLRMMKAFDENEFEYVTLPNEEFCMESIGGFGYKFEVATASLSDVIGWALKAGIPIPDDFYAKVFPGKVTDAKAITRPDKANEQLGPEALTAKERRELGQLRIEKQKWNESISAAVAAGFHFASLPKGTKVKKDEVIDFIYNAGHKDLPLSTIDKIRDALPEELKHPGGRTKGSKNVHQE